MTIPLTKPDLRDADLKSMADSIYSGAIEQGPLVSRLEDTFSEMIGAKGGVATNSATSAIVLGLRAMGVGPNDEVIFPSYTCSAILHAVVQSGATPILVDSECIPTRMDYNVNPNHIAKAVTKRTKAVILPHMFGVAADVLAIRNLGVPVIEDITLSVGAEIQPGRLAGSIGDLAVCSFHASKMVTCGEGGILIANDERLLSRARELNGWQHEQVEQRYGAPIQPYTLRYNFRLSDIHAACGLSQLQRLPNIIARRRSLAKRYVEALRGLKDVVVPEVDLPGVVYFRFIVFISKRAIVEVLRAFARHGIEAGRGVYPPLHHVLRLQNRNFPGVETAIGGALSIPLYPALTDDEIDKILAVAVDILDLR